MVGEEQGNLDYQETEQVDISDLFPFLPGEKRLLALLCRRFRDSLTSLEPAELRKAATCLFALERLPYTTPGVAIDMAKVEQRGEDSHYVSIEIDESSFRLSVSGAEYNEGIGSDSYSETLLELESGGYREGHIADFQRWLECFVASTGRLQLEEYSESEVDLSHVASDDGWDRLAEYWNSTGDGDFNA